MKKIQRKNTMVSRFDVCARPAETAVRMAAV
jgi:hypothetical protein